MKKQTLSNISLTFLAFSIVTFGIVVGLGALIKKLELTIGLLGLPILLGIISDITAIASLVKKDGSKLHALLTIIFSTLLTIFILLFMSMLRGLWKFT
jgi:hypothetical protein